jgi:hypothetical protein
VLVAVGFFVLFGETGMGDEDAVVWEGVEDYVDNIVRLVLWVFLLQLTAVLPCPSHGGGLGKVVVDDIAHLAGKREEMGVCGGHAKWDRVDVRNCVVVVE